MKLTLTTIIAAMVLGTMAAGAQTVIQERVDSAVASHQFIDFGKGEALPSDSARTLITRFYEDQFRNFQDPLAPYFLFLSKDRTLAMGVGGCVRMRGYYDWGGAIPVSGFAPYMIPMATDVLKERQLGTTPAGSALFFRVIGTNKKLGEYQLYIEANFNGYKARDFHLKKAYAIINDWTIGYASSTFSDPTALPPTVDAQGPNCKMSATAVLVRWMHTFRHGWSLAASVENHGDGSYTVTPGHTAQITQYIPDGAAFVQKTFGSYGHVRLAGIVRSLPYRSLLDGKNHHPAGWGVQISTALHPTRSLTLYGCCNGGKGCAGLGGDWLMGAYDLVADPATPNRLYAPGVFGGYGAVRYDFNTHWMTSATFGAARYCPSGTPDGSEYRQGLYMAVNVFWNLTSRIQAGAEFNLGRRQNFSGETRWARRLGLMAQFSF